jgi:hypothetical protein
MQELMSAKVFLIGSGGRIKNNFLPAFSYLGEQFDLAGLYSPTANNRRAVCEHWNINEFDSLDANALKDADVVVISIITHHVPKVLEKISEACRGKILVIDTPVFASLKDFRAIKYLHRFSKVFVAEDYIHYPQFRLMRKVLKQGKLGTFQKATLSKIGYQYHGLALARSFADLKRPLKLTREHLGNEVHTTMTFSDNGSISLTEPYQRLGGWIDIQGSNGNLVYDPSAKYSGSAEFNLSQYIDKNGNMIFALNGEPFADEDQPAPYAFLKGLAIEDTSDFNTLKTCGLIDVLKKIHHEDSMAYNWHDAVYDSALSKIAWRRDSLSGWKSRVAVWAANFAANR